MQLLKSQIYRQGHFIPLRCPLETIFLLYCFEISPSKLMSQLWPLPRRAPPSLTECQAITVVFQHATALSYCLKLFCESSVLGFSSSKPTATAPDKLNIHWTYNHIWPSHWQPSDSVSRAGRCPETWPSSQLPPLTSKENKAPEQVLCYPEIFENLFGYWTVVVKMTFREHDHKL